MRKNTIKKNGNGNGQAHGNGNGKCDIDFLKRLETAFLLAGRGECPKGKSHHVKPVMPTECEEQAKNCAKAAKALTEERYSDVGFPIKAIIEWLSASKNRDFSMPNGEKLMFAKCIVQVLECIPKRVAAVSEA